MNLHISLYQHLRPGNIINKIKHLELLFYLLYLHIFGKYRTVSSCIYYLYSSILKMNQREKLELKIYLLYSQKKFYEPSY